MSRHHVSGATPNFDVGKSWRLCSRTARIARFAVATLILWLAALNCPVLADAASPQPGNAQPAANGEKFGQYLDEHEADLAPFVSNNGGYLAQQAVPAAMQMVGWIFVVGMLVGWGIDVVMSRGLAFFFAPAYAEIKRSIVYATGRLVLSFVYLCLMGLALVICVEFSSGGFVLLGVFILLLIVAFAAQIVWIQYLYRMTLFVSLGFLLAIILVQWVVGPFMAKSILQLQAASAVNAFIDKTVTPRLVADTDAMHHQLAGVAADRDAVKAKVADLQSQVSQAEADQEQLSQVIESQTKTDSYVLSQIIQTRARGDLASARDQFTSFPSRFPTSSLNAIARTQLAQVTAELATQDAQKKQEEADAARAAAEARAELLARAGKGEVTLSEMRQVLIGKSRDQVSGLLGPPSDTATDSWAYRQQMIVNPITNEKSGLMVYFSEGTVQSVDYNQSQAAAGPVQQQ